MDCRQRLAANQLADLLGAAFECQRGTEPVLAGKPVDEATHQL
jgi:hypothetical protein